MAAHLVFGLFLVAGGAALIRRRAWSRPALEAGCWVALVYTGVMGLAECLWSLVFMWQRVPVSIVLHALFMFAALFQLRPLRLAALVSMIVVLRGAPVRSALQMTDRAPGGVA